MNVIDVRTWQPTLARPTIRRLLRGAIAVAMVCAITAGWLFVWALYRAENYVEKQQCERNAALWRNDPSRC